MFYIDDKVKDNFDDIDYFDGKEYVDKLMKAIQNKHIQSIGIYGKWGIGKTSLIKNTINLLKKKEIYEEKNIVEYNAWKYSEFDFMRDFLIVCSSSIESKDKAKEREESYYSDRIEETQLYNMLSKKFKNFVKCSWKMLLFLLVMYILSLVAILVVNHCHPNWYEASDLITPLTLTLISFILPLFLVSEITQKSYSKKFSPEQFARDFREIIKDKKVLIVIDDIDRCDYKEIKSTFDTLKTFILDENYDVKFIIPVDPNILFNSLEEQTYDYFTKIIDYSIEIKKYMPIKFEVLKNEILLSVKLEYKLIASDGLYLASKYYIDTPRKMKKFSNEFINEIYNYTPEQLTSKGFMFSKLIILKNEFPQYYQQLVKNYENTKEATQIAIDEYNKKGHEKDSNQKGVNFGSNLIEFLTKTDNVDLYDFPLYETKTNYAEYKIKKICESPLNRNAFDENIKIDLNENKKILKYEFKENIIKPLENNSFIFSEPFKRVLFLVSQFYGQNNNHVFDECYDKLINIKKNIYNDENLFVDIKKENDEIQDVLNIKYISESLNPWIILMKNQEKEILKDEFILESLNLISESITYQFDYIEKEVLLFLEHFNKETNISDESITKIINIYLEKDFAFYYNNLNWFLIGSPTSDSPCYIDEIINLVESETEYSEIELENYLNIKYAEHSCEDYFKSVIAKVDVIINNIERFSFIIKPLILNITADELSFEDGINFISSIGFLSTNKTLSDLVYKIINILPETETFEDERFTKMLKELGGKINNGNFEDMGIEIFLRKQNTKSLKNILDYNEENNSFNNFDILKKHPKLFSTSTQTKEMVKIVCNTYKLKNNYVLKSDLERHNMYTAKHYKLFKELIHEDINSYIYLIDDLTEEQTKNMNLSELDLQQLKLVNINNEQFKKQLLIFLKNKTENIIKKMKINKDEPEELKILVLQFLQAAELLYISLNYSDKSFWEKLKQVDDLMGYSKLIDVFYLRELKNTNLIELFLNGKYKESYFKNNTYAEKVFNFMLSN